MRTRGREAVVLAGGFGTRLAHIVSDVPKPMASVAGRPFLRFLLDSLAEHGFCRVVIADGCKRECIESYFGGGYRGMDILYSSEDGPLLTGGAAKQALEHCRNDWVFVLNGDTYLDVDYDALESTAASSRGAEAVIAGKRMDDLGRYGSLSVEPHGNAIVSFKEKNTCKEGVINAGVYLIKRNALSSMPRVFSLEKDYFEGIVSEGRLLVSESRGFFIDIGVEDDYRRAQKLFLPYTRKWKVAFFDRDGTVNVDTGHLFEPGKLALIPSTVDLLKCFNENADWKVVVVTNQAGIAKGLYSVDQMHTLHRHLDAALSRYGAHIDAYYYCPHHPEFSGPCSCRKPRPGMLLKAMFDYDADPDDCMMFGDKDTDRMAASAAGIENYRHVGDARC